jgi:hypothetical protein
MTDGDDDQKEFNDAAGVPPLPSDVPPYMPPYTSSPVGSGTTPEDEELSENLAPEIPKEDVPPGLLDNAVDIVRNVVRGNGIDPDHITLKSFDGEVLNFECWECFKIEPVIAQRRVVGKAQGIVAGSQTDMRARMNADIANTTTNHDVRKQTDDILRRRLDLGFGIDYMVIRLDKMNKSYVVHEKCVTCGGSKGTPCKTCGGKGKTNCLRCNGTKRMVCPACKGLKIIKTAKSKRKCRRCNGMGRVNCLPCRQTGSMPCAACQGKGKARCATCNATGWRSLLGSLGIKAKSRFEFNPELMPEEVAPMIEELRSKLVTEKHAAVLINNNIIRERELHHESKPQEFIVPYHVRLPWGKIVINAEDKSLDGKLFGFNPRLLQMPPFMEELAAPELKLLTETVLNPADIVTKVKKMVERRALGDLFIANAFYTPVRAIDYMKKAYPIGFQDITIPKILQEAHQVLRALTQKPRMMGLIGGLVAATVVEFGYFHLGGRGALAAILPKDIPTLAFDMMLAGGGGWLSVFASQMAGRGVMLQALGDILTPYQRKKIIPKASLSAINGYLGGFLISGIMVAATVMKGTNVPEWVAPLMKGLGL